MPRATLTDGERAFVAAQRAARLATVDAAGFPHVVPVCYAFDGRRFYTPLDEKPKRVDDRSLQRVRNIEADPRVALVIDRYEDDWSRLVWLQVRGRAEILDPADTEHSSAVGLLRARYRQYRTMALEAHPIIAIVPERVTSWRMSGDMSAE